MVPSPSNNKLITVVLPVFNGETFIGEAITSVMAQNYKPLEFIIVNDGSTDRTEQVVKQFENQICYIYQDNAGPSKARNTGIKAAHGEYITFIDADDVWHNECINLHLAQFKKYQDLDISIGLTYQTSFKTIYDIDEKLAKKEALFLCFLGASVIKRTVFDEVGLFDEELFLAQDTDWFLRVREMGKSISVHRNLVAFYRRHQKNRTNDKRMVKYYLLKVFKKAKDRKAGSEIKKPITSEKPSNMDELIKMWNTV